MWDVVFTNNEKEREIKEIWTKLYKTQWEIFFKKAKYYKPKQKIKYIGKVECYHNKSKLENYLTYWKS